MASINGKGGVEEECMNGLGEGVGLGELQECLSEFACGVRGIWKAVGFRFDDDDGGLFAMFTEPDEC
ncbi:MAG: hypothetical protein RL215_366 [Planctomycetota bacterium]|jgi:hypothetical protein